MISPAIRLPMLAGLCLLLAAAGSVALWRAYAEDDRLDNILASRRLRVGYAVEAPYAFVDSQGRVSGESPELARLVVAKLASDAGVNIQIDWVQTRFDLLLVGLDEQRFDLVAAGMFITPERARKYAFSTPTLKVREGLLLPSNGAQQPFAFSDLVEQGIRIAVVAGSVEEQRLQAHGLPRQRLFPVPDANSGKDAILAGAVGALALSLPTVRWMAQNDPSRLSARPLIYNGDSEGDGAQFRTAFVFDRESGNLLKAWNGAQRTVHGGALHLQSLQALGLTPDDLEREAAMASGSAR